jgi:hypothetical protein
MQRRHWKLLGLAGIAGVAATGAVVARRRREHVEYDPEDLRAKLHERLDETEQAAGLNGSHAAGAAAAD